MTLDGYGTLVAASLVLLLAEQWELQPNRHQPVAMPAWTEAAMPAPLTAPSQAAAATAAAAVVLPAAVPAVAGAVSPLVPLVLVAWAPLSPCCHQTQLRPQQTAQTYRDQGYMP